MNMEDKLSKEEDKITDLLSCHFEFDELAIIEPVFNKVVSAMQTYAEQEACGFNVWSRDEALYIGDDQWAYEDSFYTTSQLFKIYQNETNTKG